MVSLEHICKSIFRMMARSHYTLSLQNLAPPKEVVVIPAQPFESWDSVFFPTEKASRRRRRRKKVARRDREKERQQSSSSQDDSKQQDVVDSATASVAELTVDNS